MRLRPLLFTLLALAIATDASAQQVKKKKPKKPRTEQSDDAPSRDEPPPPIDTNLKEEDAPAPSSNPWVASGEAKKRGAPDDSKDGEKKDRVSSAWSDRGPERKKNETSDWISRPLAVTAEGGYASANLRIGFGVRVGYSIYDKLYVGGAFTYHLGTRFGDTTLSFYYPAAEVGYDYHVQGFTIRPYAGVGAVFLRVTGPSADDIPIKDGNALAIYPGTQFDYQYGPAFFGVDLRFLLVFQDGQDTSIGFFAVGGARF